MEHGVVYEVFLQHICTKSTIFLFLFLKSMLYYRYVRLGGIDAGVKLGEFEEGTQLILRIYAQDNHMDLGAVINRILDSNTILIDLEFSGTQRLVFDNVQVDVECPQENDLPLIWHNAKVISYQSYYVVQVHTEGVRKNRRGAFRVSVAQMAKFRMDGRAQQQVMVKDISITGFSISDRKKELGLSLGDKGSISFEDWGYQIDLTGRMVRIEEREDMTIYGFQICSQCNELASYINVRQRRNMNQR